jgi:hypothetical protein
MIELKCETCEHHMRDGCTHPVGWRESDFSPASCRQHLPSREALEAEVVDLTSRLEAEVERLRHRADCSGTVASMALLLIERALNHDWDDQAAAQYSWLLRKST